ncbi:MAG: hypothetical protein IPM63_11650 [Acidobacteriota bacterium]|nr:MAG: hypothetical protein IPM63_11650 [Acidobacteriota bacterium]
MKEKRLKIQGKNDENIASRKRGDRNQDCEIKFEVKRRNGQPKYWCSVHRAPAWDTAGNVMTRCSRADLPSIPSNQVLELNLSDYPGGIAVWGALPAIYDTYGKGFDRGIHIHARRIVGGTKVIDRTYKTVFVKDDSRLFDQVLEVSEGAAVSYVASVIFGVNMKFLHCSHCQAVHHDEDFFAVNEHVKHQCNNCGREFFDRESGVSNPTMAVKSLLGDLQTQRPVVSPKRSLKISQRQCPRGLQIWASNPAIIWTSPKLEESGIHLHGYSESGKRIIDDTFDSVEVDGLTMDENQARFYMAQTSLPFLRNAICTLECPSCRNEHFDVERAVDPHNEHTCEFCGAKFKSPNNRKVVSNPFASLLDRLKANHEEMEKASNN